MAEKIFEPLNAAVDRKDAPSAPRKKRHRWRRRLLLLLLAVSLLALFHAPLLHGAARFLIVGRPCAELTGTADAIVPLGGADTRKRLALELFRAGRARNLVLLFNEFEEYGTPFYDTGRVPEVAERYLVNELGIPREEIHILRGVTSTYDEARALLRLLRERSWQRVVVVDTAFHTRRSRWIFRRVFGPEAERLDFVSVPLEREKMALNHWWTRERELVYVFEEYLKLGLYLCKYRNLTPEESGAALPGGESTGS